MAAVTRLGLYGGPRAAYAEIAAVITAALSGTAAVGITEADVVAGGKTLVLTISGDTWVASGATFDAQRQAIINGLISAQAEPAGWNAEVRDKLAVTAVVRTSDTVVTVTLAAAPAYAVDANETITATIPAAALVTSGVAVVASPALTVTAQAAGRSGVNRLALSQEHATTARAPTLADVGRRREELRARSDEVLAREPVRAGDFVDPESGAIVRAPARSKAKPSTTSGLGIDAPLPGWTHDDIDELAVLLEHAEARRRAMTAAAVLLYYAEAA